MHYIHVCVFMCTSALCALCVHWCIYVYVYIVQCACVLVGVSHWLCVSACVFRHTYVCGGDTPFFVKLISVLSQN